MRCEEADTLIESLVEEGVAPAGALRDHLDTCSRCVAALRLARAIESVLAIRETPEPPSSFTQRVMGRVRRERWRAEQLLDAGFNAVLVTGVFLIIGGGAALAAAMGLFGGEVTLVRLATAGATELAARMLPQAQIVGLAAMMLFSALGLWWWVEADEVGA